MLSEPRPRSRAQATRKAIWDGFVSVAAMGLAIMLMGIAFELVVWLFLLLAWIIKGLYRAVQGA